MSENLGPDQFDEKNSNEKESLIDKMSRHSRTIARGLGLLALFSLLNIRKEDTPGITQDLPRTSINRLSGGTHTPESLALKEYHLDQDAEKIRELRESYDTLTEAMEKISNGTLYDGEYKDKLLSLENTSEEIGNDYLSIMNRILDHTSELRGSERWRSLSDSLNYLLNFYTNESKNMSGEELDQFKAESALAFGTFINEFLGQVKAGNIEQTAELASDAGLVDDVNKVVEAMRTSDTTAKITSNSVNVYEDGQITNLGEATYLQNVGKELIDLPLSMANNVEITNLYDLKENDPDEYTETLEDILHYNSDYLMDVYREKTGNNINKEELRGLIEQSINTGNAIESTKTLPNIEKISFDYNLGTLFKYIPMLECQVSWGDNKQLYAVNYDYSSYGGRVSETMLCQGNGVKIISMKDGGTTVSPDRTTVSVPLILFFLPLLGVRRRKKDEENKGERKRNVEVEVNPPRPKPPITYPINPEDPEPHKIKINSRGIETGAIPLVENNDPTDEIIVYAKIVVDPETGRITIIESGETKELNPVKDSRFHVKSVE